MLTIPLIDESRLAWVSGTALGTDVEPDVKAPPHPLPLPQPSKGAIAFENVTFHYPTRPDFAALNGFSLKVEPGEAITLVGPSGAGKSTVFQLLLRYFAPQDGSILFDGMNVADLDPADLRKHISLVA